MSNTPSKKKPAVKPVEQKARYSIGQKVFIIERLKRRTGEVLQAEVLVVREIKHPMITESGKIGSLVTDFEYDLRTCYGEFEEIRESQLYPTLQSVAMAFTHNFTTLLK